MPHTDPVNGKEKVLVAQSCLTLCNPTDCSLPGSTVRGILQVRILVWVAMPSSGDLPNLGKDMFNFRLIVQKKQRGVNYWLDKKIAE